MQVYDTADKHEVYVIVDIWSNIFEDPPIFSFRANLHNYQHSWHAYKIASNHDYHWAIALKVHAYKNNFVIKSATLRTVFSCIYVYVVVDLISDSWRGSSYTNMW